MDRPRDILLGVVIGAHGLKGEVKVKTFTAEAGNLHAYGALHTKNGLEIAVMAVRLVKADLVVVQFAGVADRNGADALKGTELFIAREALPPTDADEFYHADLVGLRAEDSEGRTIGTVRGIHNFGAGDVIEILRADGSDIFLPFTRETVPEVDMKAGRLVIAVPEEEEFSATGNVE